MSKTSNHLPQFNVKTNPKGKKKNKKTKKNKKQKKTAATEQSLGPRWRPTQNTAKTPSISTKHYYFAII